MSRYIVAGATGRVGSVAARELLARGVKPAVIVRTESARADWVLRGADALVGSLGDVAFLIGALMGAGLPQQLAEAVAEMMDAFAKGKIVPSGDRQLVGTTTIDEVIRDVVRS